MDRKESEKNYPPMAFPTAYTTDFVTSADGTKIHYRKTGAGQGVILVHGAMMYSDSFSRLAGLLADDFTVYIPDRCGRGLSEMHADHCLQKEGEDIEALIDKTGTENIFGLSSGAVVTLQAALGNSRLKKVALYEPALLTDKSRRSQRKLAEGYRRAMAGLNYGKAFASIIKDTADEGSFIKRIPAFVLSPLMKGVIDKEAKNKTNEGQLSLKSLIWAMQYDLRLVGQSEALIDQIRAVKADVLLLGGEKSAFFLKEVLGELGSRLPRAQRVTFPKAGHTAAENHGNPERVAAELKKFFKAK
jgi:pimeloyl-ACP methyl ester carboxylesterase